MLAAACWLEGADCLLADAACWLADAGLLILAGCCCCRWLLLADSTLPSSRFPFLPFLSLLCSLLSQHQQSSSIRSHQLASMNKQASPSHQWQPASSKQPKAATGSWHQQPTVAAASLKHERQGREGKAGRGRREAKKQGRGGLS